MGWGSSGPTWAHPQALQQDPCGAHQQAAHRLVGEELGGYDEVPVGRMLVVLMVVVGEGAPCGWGRSHPKAQCTGCSPEPPVQGRQARVYPGRGTGPLTGTRSSQRVQQLRPCGISLAEVSEFLVHAVEGRPGSGECTRALTCNSIRMHISSEEVGRNGQGMGL